MNEAALARTTYENELVTNFEAFVQHQQPAPTWTPVTPFDLESRRIVEGKHPQLIIDTFGDEQILDYGCGPDQILVRLLQERGADVYGYDPQLDGSERVVSLRCDGFYGLVICREVLEHCTVKELVRVVRDLVRLSGQYIYVTTRFTKRPHHLLSVETEFDVDPTHITCLTKPFLRLLFVLEGCKSRPDLEEKMDWRGLGRCLVFEVS